MSRNIICKIASQIVEWYHSGMSCALNMEDFISYIFLEIK
jgi:hypothetical protein